MPGKPGIAVFVQGPSNWQVFPVVFCCGMLSIIINRLFLFGISRQSRHCGCAFSGIFDKQLALSYDSLVKKRVQVNPRLS